MSPISATILLMMIDILRPKYSFWIPPPKGPTNAPITYSEAARNKNRYKLNLDGVMVKLKP